MSHLDRVPYAEIRVLADLRRFRRRARRPHRVMEGLGGHHRALHAVRLQRRRDPPDDLRLLILAERLGRDDVGIVSRPVADSELAPFADDVFEPDSRTRRRMEQRLSLIRSRPLRTGNEILAPRLGAIGAAAGFYQAG